MAAGGEVAIVNCLGELRTALAALEGAAQASLRANDVRLHELDLRTARECEEARSAAEDDAKRMLQKAETLEAKVDKLEEKILSKKIEASELKSFIDKMTAKLEAKNEKLLALEAKSEKAPALEDGSRRNGSANPALLAPRAVSTERQAAAEAAANGNRSADGASPSTDRRDEEAAAKRKAKEAEARRRRKRAESEEGSQSSDDSSAPADRRKQRRPLARKEARSRGRDSQASDSSSRSPESRGGRERERARAGGSREARSRDRARGHRRAGGSPGRSDSRERSRSRRPWHQSSGGKGGSKGGGGKGRDAGLCIPFVMGKCHWGEKCRERHPDPDDARAAKENLQAKVCRFGMDCRRRDCIFKHPDGKRHDK